MRAPAASLLRRSGNMNTPSSVFRSSSSSQKDLEPLRDLLPRQPTRTSDDHVQISEQRDTVLSASPELLDSVILMDASHTPSIKGC